MTEGNGLKSSYIMMEAENKAYRALGAVDDLAELVKAKQEGQLVEVEKVVDILMSIKGFYLDCYCKGDCEEVKANPDFEDCLHERDCFIRWLKEKLGEGREKE